VLNSLKKTSHNKNQLKGIQGQIKTTEKMTIFSVVRDFLGSGTKIL